VLWLVLGLVAFLLALRLVFGAHPWNAGIAKRLAEGRPPRPSDYVRTYEFWACAVNLVALGVLFASRRLWLRLGPAPEPRPRMRPGRVPGWIGAGIAAAVVAFALLGAPRLSQSFWGDEAENIRTAVEGSYQRDREGTIAFHRVRWRDTLWYYNGPTNHVFFSVLARLSVGAWRAVARPEVHFGSELAARLPVYLAGLLAVATLGVLLCWLHAPLAALVAAWLFALHPWHLRYATEARGYGVMLFLMPLALLLFLRALSRGSYGRWLAFGVAEVLLLWSFPGVLFYLVVANAGGALWLLRNLRTAWAREQAIRLSVATVAAAMLWLQLNLPNVFQLLAYFGSGSTEMNTAAFLPVVLSHLAVGAEWRVSSEAGTYVYLSGLMASATRLWWSAGAVAVVLAWVGVSWLARRSAAHRIALATFLLPGPLTYGLAWLRGDWVYPWYFVFTLPGLVALVAFGLESLARTGRHRPLSQALAALAAIAVVTGYAALSEPVRADLRARPIEPARESVLIMRPSLDPFDPANERIVTLTLSSAQSYYDPHAIPVRELAALRRVLARADAEGKTVYLVYGREGLARRRNPEIFELLQQEELFEHVASLAGTSPRGVQHIFRYRGGAVGRDARVLEETSAGR
jgi:hypothetical protein